MSLERVGYFMGLMGLVFALYAHNAEGETPLHWVGLALVAFGFLVLVKERIRPTLQFLVFRRSALENIFEIAQDQNIPDVVHTTTQLARSGKIQLYGELGASKRLTPIPRSYFEEHAIGWLPGVSLRTYSSSRTFGDQDTDECYFNLHGPISLLKLLRQKHGAANTSRAG
jgi:hypothetical protein